MFILKLTYTKPIAEVDRYLVEHRAWLDTLYTAREALCSGPQNPRTGGIIILSVKDKQRVEAIIAADPFHREGVATYEVIEFDPVKYAPEIAALI